MKLKVISLLTMLGFAFGNMPAVTAADIPYEVPKLVSFTVSQKSIDVNTPNAKLTFTLVVSHPAGIRSTKTSLWFKSKDSRISVSTTLTKQGGTVTNNQYKFVGDLALDPSFPAGLYDFYAEPIEGEPGGRDLLIPKTTNLYPENFNYFLGGEKSVAVRTFGKLNLDSKTFVGPSHASTSFLNDDYPNVFGSETPIFRVDEYYDPSKFFIVRVPSLQLKVESLTPTTCRVENELLKFVDVGTCSYRVFTNANDDYLSTSITLNSNILAPRVRPTLSMPFVGELQAKNVPIFINTFWDQSSSGDVKVKTDSPEVCFGDSRKITVIGGGICKLSVQSVATNNYLASDLYTLIFDVTKDTQTVTFKPQATVDLSAKTLDLTATASSNGAVTFTSSTTDICTVSGTKLNLLKSGNCNLVASQAGTPLIAAATANATVQITGAAPAKTRTITCIKGKKSKKVTGVKPKCPKGFKRS